MPTVILTKDHRGLGKRGDEYSCASDKVAAKLVRLGRAVYPGADLPCAETVPEPSEVAAPAYDDEQVTSFEDLQASEDEALLAACADATEVDDLVDQDVDE